MPVLPSSKEKTKTAQERRYLKIRPVIGLATLVVGFLAANLALFNWVEGKDICYLLGDYARYVCAYGGFAAMISGAMMVNDFLVTRRTAEPKPTAGYKPDRGAKEKSKQKSLSADKAYEKHRLADVSIAFFCIILSISALTVSSLISCAATATITPKWATEFLAETRTLRALI
ncbi:MAG: hypothetical protein NWF14_07060 [Candidatus Bathyarchaeota archaeon]|nr:hypothetical protein [Candidatus Bathyarchaeota archaeon]